MRMPKLLGAVIITITLAALVVVLDFVGVGVSPTIAFTSRWLAIAALCVFAARRRSRAVKRCGWAPAERDWDAVRFAIISPALSSRDTPAPEIARARILRLTYVYERGNRPAGQGNLEFDLSTATWLRRHDDARIQKMAECFLESYLSRRG